MFITLNGETTEHPDDFPLAELIATLNLEGKRFAIEINQQIIPRSSFANHRLHEGDVVEIVNAIGGG